MDWHKSYHKQVESCQAAGWQFDLDIGNKHVGVLEICAPFKTICDSGVCQKVRRGLSRTTDKEEVEPTCA